MELLHKICAGLDVHKATVVACVRRASGPTVELDVRTFATTTGELIALSDWLAECGVTCAAMEATGVYWKPVWHILSDDERELMLVNAAHVKNVPGRKTDVNDATWLAELVAHGLVRASFVPPREVEELRGLMRTRKQFVRERVAHVQRLQKTLETANIKLDSVIADIVGLSGRAMLEGLIAGETDARKLAGLGHSRLRATPAELAAALTGRVTAHHRMMLRLHLDHIDAIDKALTTIDAQASANLDPFREAAELIQSVDGIGELAARGILAEIGLDMSRFPTHGHLLSWAGLVPRNDESAGKRRSTKLRKGGTWLKTLLVQCAWAAVRKKDTYLSSQFQSLKGRRGGKKAIMAVAGSMLTAIYHMLQTGELYRDLGPQHMVQRSLASQTRRLTKQLQSLGFAVTITQLQPTQPVVSF
jgi:transposase